MMNRVPSPARVGIWAGMELDAALTLGVPVFPPRLLERFRG